MTAATWVSAIAAALAVVFAVFSWWRSTQSRKAKVDAETAAANAAAQLAAVQAIAESLEGQPLKLKRIGTVGLRLRNRLKRPVTIVGVGNADEFLGFGLDMPVTLQPGESVDIDTGEFFGHMWPGQMVVRLAGRGEPVHVPVPD